MSVKFTHHNVVAFFIAALWSTGLLAQPGIGISYRVSDPSVPRPTITSPTVALSTVNAVSTVQRLGGTFTYGGVAYDGFVASVNGWIALVKPIANGGAATGAAIGTMNGAAANDLTTPSAATGGGYPIIAPLWDNFTAANVGYNLQANVPGFGSNVWCIRWSTCTWGAVAGNTFYVLLNPANGNIRFVYEAIQSTVSTGSASIGLTGACDGDYYSWTTLSDQSLTATGVSGNTVTFATTPTGLSVGATVLPGNTNTASFTINAAQTSNTFLPFSIAPAGVVAGMYVFGPNVPAGTTVVSVSATAPIGVTISGAGTTALNPILSRFSFGYFPAGTTITGGVGTTSLTLSNTAGGAFNASATTFRILAQRNDSTQHNGNIGSGTAAPRPGAPGVAYYLDWTPGTPWNDNCTGTSLSCTGANPTITFGAAPITWATTHATASSSGAVSCSPGGTDNADVWFKVTKPTGVTSFNVITATNSCSPVTGTSVEVFSGACGGLTSVTCNTNASGNFGIANVTGADPCVAATYYIRVTGDANQSNKFQISVVNDASAGSTCATANPIASIPFQANCLTTSGMINDYSTNGCNAGYGGEDLVYTYTPTNNECVTLTTSGGTGTNGGIFVFDGCPATGNCIGYGTSASANVTATVSLIAGTTYYFVIDAQAGTLSNFTFTVSSAGAGAPANDEPGAAQLLNLSLGACTYTQGTTLCASASIGCGASLATSSCGSYNANADVWYRVNVPPTGVLTITTQGGTSGPTIFDPVMALYTGTCGSFTEVACNDNTTGFFPAITATGLTAGSTVYIRVWPKTATASGNFGICVQTCNGPSGDNCAAAIALGTPTSSQCVFGSTYSTFCANPTASAPAPTCGAPAGNDIWFTITVPASGNLALTAAPGATSPASNLAMALYSGTCGALTQVANSCSQNGSGYQANYPAISLTGLPGGTTYYLRVWDETGGTSGSFNLCATTYCIANDEPCSAIPLTTSVGTPTFGNYTNTCATTSCGIPNATCALGQSTSLGSANVLTGGSGYTPSTTFTGVTATFAGATPTTAPTFTVTTDALGAINSITITNGGAGFPLTPTNCFTGTLNVGSGTPALNNPTTPASITVGRQGGYNDVWFSVVVPVSGNLTITSLTGTLSDPVMQVYSGTCGSLTPLICDDDGGPGLASEVNICSSSGLITPGQTLYIRMFPYSRYTAQGTFQLAAFDPAAAAANPYQADNPCCITQNFPVTFGSCSNYTYMSLRCYTPTTNANFPGIPNPFQCWPLGGGGFGSDGWSPSNDLWVRVIVPPGVTGMNFLTQSGTEYDDNMAVYRVTSPCSNTTCTGQLSLTQLGCDDLNGPGLMPYLSLGGLVPGETLYVRHYPWFGGTTRQGDFYFCVEAACTTSVPNDDPCVALNVPVNSGCIYNGPYTTSCASVTQQSGLTNPSCGGFTVAGTGMTRDVWFTLTVPASGQVSIDVRSINIADAAMAVYTAAACTTGTTFNQVGCDDNSSANPAMPYLYLTGLTPGATLYIRIWGRNGGSGQFEICATDPCPLGPPPNDDPCNAIVMTTGVTYSGYNSCATATNDPATYPACFTLGNANTVWYRFTAPSSSVNITTTLGSLTNTQIALYQGSFCFSLIQLGTWCNDNYSQCGTPTNASQIIATGLTPGGTYYIMLDGYQNLTGTFGITVYDANAALPATPQQDCPLATVICSPQTIFGSPGFVGAGNYCDLGPGGAAYGCVPATGARENNSAWFAFNTDTTGILLFDILPTSTAANYDWVLWNITGNTLPNGAPNGTICQQITANTASIAACNYESATTATSGATGMNNSGTCLQCGAGQGAYSSGLLVNAGETYLLMINNTSGTTAGFTLDFSNTPVVQYVSANPLNWSGGSNSTWTTPANWGGCGYPDCAIGANILPGLNQPVIGGTETVKDVIINPGASLTLLPGCTLNVCGNFINNGSLTASVTSTVRFIGTGAQTISGNLSSTSRFGNLVIDKVSGQVNMNTTVEVGGNFTTANGTSIFNLNNRILRLYGNFTNANGNTTIIGVGAGGGGSTVEFAGSTPQTYTNNGSNLVLNNVTMNQPLPGSSVTLASNATSNLITGPSGILTFTSGKFITGATNEVVVQNTAAAGASIGNSFSFVNGWLRRYFAASAFTYDFAVGEALTGYQRATLEFTTAPSAPYQLAMRFLRWGGSNLPLVNGIYPPLECANYDWSQKQALNHGYWTTTASTATPTGVYNLTLANSSQTNYTGSTSTSYPVSTGQAVLGTTLNFATTAGLTVGMNVLGVGIPSGATITAVTATTITLSLSTISLVSSGQYVDFFTSGATGRFDALTIMKDTTAYPGSGGWKMEAICPCNNTYPPPPKPQSKRYQYNASVSGFSNFASVQFGTALPVELMAFDAKQTSEGNLCQWTTASETNNDYFVLERSYDGESFEDIGSVRGYGPGTTSEIHEYQFLDKDPCSGVVYYRLRQVDIDLNATNSDVIALNCMKTKDEITLFPNPASDKITYTFYENSDGVIDVQLVDLMGKSVKWERFSVNKGYNSLRSSIEDLASGIYYLKIQRIDMTSEAKMIRFTRK